MSKWIVILLTGVVLGGGCAGNGKAKFDPSVAKVGGAESGSRLPGAEGETTGKSPDLIITPEHTLVGKVVRYHEAGRFVVLDFPLGQLPKAERRMFIYRDGLKVGEVKINAWQREQYIVADLVAGEARQGDDVRSN